MRQIQPMSRFVVRNRFFSKDEWSMEGIGYIYMSLQYCSQVVLRSIQIVFSDDRSGKLSGKCVHKSAPGQGRQARERACVLQLLVRFMHATHRLRYNLQHCSYGRVSYPAKGPRPPTPTLLSTFRPCCLDSIRATNNKCSKKFMIHTMKDRD